MKLLIKIIVVAFVVFAISLHSSVSMASKLATGGIYMECTEARKNVCHVTFSQEIIGQGHYLPFINLLRSADADDTIYLHLSGNGGLANTLYLLDYNMRHTKAKTIAIVEGDVYSAHAFLAISAKFIDINPEVNFLFHRSSAYGMAKEYCGSMKGKVDRTQDAEQKCNIFMRYILKKDRAFTIRTLKGLLTEKEMEDILKGHDIILTGKEMIRRLAK